MVKVGSISLATKKQIFDVKLDGNCYFLVLKLIRMNEMYKITPNNLSEYFTFTFIGEDHELEVTAICWDTDFADVKRNFVLGKIYCITFIPEPSMKRSILASTIFDIPIKESNFYLVNDTVKE